MDFSNWILNKVEDDPNFTKRILWTNDTNFCRNTQVNFDNAHYWSAESSHWVLCTTHQYQWSLNVWCGIRGDSFWDLIFLQISWWKILSCKNFQVPSWFQICRPIAQSLGRWFQHDGAPPHMHSQVRNWLNSRDSGLNAEDQSNGQPDHLTWHPWTVSYGAT